MNKLQIKKYIKKMNYFGDQQGILNRYIENSNYWNSHLNNTREYIINSFINHKSNSAAILGSGWLLDIPIKEISEFFKEIYLYDIVHPLPIRKKYFNHPKIKLIDFDITGGIVEKIYFELKRKKIKKNIKQIIDEIEFNEITEFKNFDFVVSANLLNQLNILIEEYLKELFYFDKNDIIDFSKKIQQLHFNSLPENKTCLITDYEEIYMLNDEEFKRESLIYIDFIDIRNIKKWKWYFDMNGRYRKGYNTVFEVIAFEK